MRFRDIYLPTDVDNVENKETNNDVLDLGSFSELDFAEQYLDTDGILHIKTFFPHSDLDESELWEVFVPEKGSCPLELLLPEGE